ncbi:branched-chain amino acid ABC transporter permease [Aquabacter sp. P-9]|uniref:branched-chain amino acid ABC transporter permease n=1 Tax=Aquabacter sediminis TaxID=3029197 RepID=UPI00237E8DAB|nr:branched-chain amino acid ABC transporter permease [Aquabacter sp. P-9]MDE1569105.1 branched-chain amino acid ABC transporter permease [Aquabacter sp. P-9]
MSPAARTTLGVALLVVAVALLAAAPLVLNNYWLRVLTTVFMYAIVTQGLNVIVGLAGYHAFGNAVFFGFGAYACGVAMTAGAPLPLGLLAGVLVSALVAGVIGWPILRLRGHYFAIATVALNLAAIQLVIQVGGLTGGAQGLALPLSDLAPGPLYRAIYLVMLAGMVGATALVWVILRLPFGYALRAIRDGERAAGVMGIDTTATKVLAWAISAGITGFAGALWAYWITFIEPSSAFDPAIGVKGYMMLILGGLGTVLGPVIGAFALEFLATLVWGGFLQAHQIVFGILIAIICLVAPNGILDAGRRAIRSWRSRHGDA